MNRLLKVTERGRATGLAGWHSTSKTPPLPVNIRPYIVLRNRIPPWNSISHHIAIRLNVASWIGVLFKRRSFQDESDAGWERSRKNQVSDVLSPGAAGVKATGEQPVLDDAARLVRQAEMIVAAVPSHFAAVGISF